VAIASLTLSMINSPEGRSVVGSKKWSEQCAQSSGWSMGEKSRASGDESPWFGVVDANGNSPKFCQVSQFSAPKHSISSENIIFLTRGGI